MLIYKVKVALRTLTDDVGITSQIQDLIDACILDLEDANIKVEKDDDGNVKNKKIEVAIIQYCKGYFFVENSEKYLQMYDSIKANLGIVNG